MDRNPHSSESGSPTGNIIVQYRLDYQQNGNNLYYIWRHDPPDHDRGERAAILVDLNNVYLPSAEIDRMVSDVLVSAIDIISLAFANCHPHNQQVIKRKLKAGNVKLYSNTAFFMDILRAKQWLTVQCT